MRRAAEKAMFSRTVMMSCTMSSSKGLRLRPPHHLRSDDAPQTAVRQTLVARMPSPSSDAEFLPRLPSGHRWRRRTRGRRCVREGATSSLRPARWPAADSHNGGVPPGAACVRSRTRTPIPIACKRRRSDEGACEQTGRLGKASGLHLSAALSHGSSLGGRRRPSFVCNRGIRILPCHTCATASREMGHENKMLDSPAVSLNCPGRGCASTLLGRKQFQSMRAIRCSLPDTAARRHSQQLPSNARLRLAPMAQTSVSSRERPHEETWNPRSNKALRRAENWPHVHPQSYAFIEDCGKHPPRRTLVGFASTWPGAQGKRDWGGKWLRARSC